MGASLAILAGGFAFYAFYLYRLQIGNFIALTYSRFMMQIRLLINKVPIFKLKKQLGFSSENFYLEQQAISDFISVIKVESKGLELVVK